MRVVVSLFLYEQGIGLVGVGALLLRFVVAFVAFILLDSRLYVDGW